MGCNRLYCLSASDWRMPASLVGTPESVSSVATFDTRSSWAWGDSLAYSEGSMVTTNEVRFPTSRRPLSS